MNDFSMFCEMPSTNQYWLKFRNIQMDPIGASSISWNWYGYPKSKILLNGEIISSVSGGGHFGDGNVDKLIGSFYDKKMDCCS